MKQITLNFLDIVSLTISETQVYKDGILKPVFNLNLFYTSPEKTNNGAPLTLRFRNKLHENGTVDLLRQCGETMLSLHLIHQRDLDDVNKIFTSRHYLLRTKNQDVDRDFININFFYDETSNVLDVMIYFYDETQETL